MHTPNLVALWEEHCRDEFEKRDVNATMATMVPQPYVNHIPTITGGVGYEQLKRSLALFKSYPPSLTRSDLPLRKRVSLN